MPPFTLIAPGTTIPSSTFLEEIGPKIRAQHESDGNYVLGMAPIFPMIIFPAATSKLGST